MKPTCLIASLTLFGASLLPVAAAEPNADQLLQQMSAKLSGSKAFTYTATREIDGALQLHGAAEKARVTVAVARPGQISGRAVSREGTRRFISDGRKVTFADETAGHYAQVPMRTTIDGLVAALDEVYGFTPPLAEFALSDVYADLKRQAQKISYAGEANSGGFLGMGGVDCHRIALSGRKADAELWVSKEDQLPRKLVVTFRREGQPQLRVTFSAWNLNASLTAADFAFAPSPGATKVELWSTARMAAAHKN